MISQLRAELDRAKAKYKSQGQKVHHCIMYDKLSPVKIKLQLFRPSEPTVIASDPSTVTHVIPQVSADDDDNEMKNELDYNKVWP